MTDTAKLLKIIKDSGIKKGNIADYLGLTIQGFMRKVKNISEFKPSEIEKLCDILAIRSLKEKDRIFFAKKDD